MQCAQNQEKQLREINLISETLSNPSLKKIGALIEAQEGSKSFKWPPSCRGVFGEVFERSTKGRFNWRRLKPLGPVTANTLVKDSVRPNNFSQTLMVAYLIVSERFDHLAGTLDNFD